jgi:S-adenosylmethionine:tRNA ribosyltransferase-isomerase
VTAGAGTTRVFLHPPNRVTAADGLFTNFHVPKSTLFMLVCAFANTPLMKRAYAHAIARRWRMLSYGDAMLILSDRSSPRDA